MSETAYPGGGEYDFPMTRKDLTDSYGRVPDVTMRMQFGSNDFSLLEPYMVPKYNLDSNSMVIRDSVWGEETIDATKSKFDELLLRLARTPLFRRTQAIEQLTLGKDFATIPSTSSISRWSHIWGSLVFIRKMNQGRDIDPRTNQTMQLRTLLSDVGHTAFSHLGDWMFQSGGLEDLHDQELKKILTVSGVKDLLEEYGFSLEETVFPDVKDWVECPSPDLNVDRVDYGLREMLRWQSRFTGLGRYERNLRDPKSLFEIVDNNLAITNPAFATKFAIGYSLLPTEHWAQPVHRLQLQLLQVAMRRILTDSLDGGNRHPRDAMYAVDNMFDHHFQSWDMLTLQNTMKNLATTQRQLFSQGRVNDLTDTFLEAQSVSTPSQARAYEFPEFPDPLEMTSWQSKNFIVPHAPNLVVEAVDTIDVDPIQVTSRGLQFALKALKPRTIDPHVVDEKGDLLRLSEFNPSYGSYLEGQHQEMSKNYLVTILTHPHFAQAILDNDIKTTKRWSEYIKRPRDPKHLKEQIDESEFWGASHRFDDITDW
ncbi:MAG: hypothetical protein WAR37_04425 [Candidatus Microsaccharimonas sp.]